MSPQLCFVLCFYGLISIRYVDDIDSADDTDANDAPLLMCLVEQLRGGMGADERVNIGMIAICPSTGDVVWDEFEGKCPIELLYGATDNSLRWPYAYRVGGELVSEFVLSANFLPFMYIFQTRMVHCKPAELLLAEQGLTKPTERMLKHFAGCVPWTPPVCGDLTPIL